MGQAITNQAGFRGRNDNGSETAATWKAVLDTNWTQPVDVKFRVRFLLTNTGNKDLADGFRLFYSHNSGTYTRVTTTSDVIQSTGSANTSWTLTDGDDTTQQLGSGTFDTGDWDDDGQTDSFTTVQAHETELEWCLTIDSATVGNGDSVELRVYLDDDTVLDNYLTGKTPNVTVSEISIVNFSATLASVTTTPDTGVLAVSLVMSATLASATTTPDTAVLDSFANFQATMAAHTSTPGNWWDPNGEDLCVWAAYQPKGATSLAASYADLSGNSHDAGVGVAPTWNAVDGWIFNGSTQYLTTVFVPHSDQSQAVIVQYTDATVNYNFLAGSYTFDVSGTAYGIKPIYDASVHYLNGLAVGAAPNLAAGNLAVSGNQGYRNGIANGGNIAASGVTPTNWMAIGARNGGGVHFHTDAHIQALAIYDCTITATQVAAVADAMDLLSAVTLSVSREMSATLAAASTAPDVVAIAVIREILAVLASATTTPDNVILSLPGGVVSFLATLASATTTPDAATIAVIRELLAVLASATATPDTVVVTISRALDAVLASETVTPDTVALAVVRELVAGLASVTTTPDTVTLDKVVALLAALAASTTTPDTTLLALSKAMVATLASATTTPDAVTLDIAGIIEFLATLAAITTTPDVASLAVARELAATLAGVTTTPDVTLALTLEFVAELASATTTPDAAIFTLMIELLATAASTTATPDIAVLSLVYELAATLAAATTTPDTVDLVVVTGEVLLAAILAAATATPSVMVNIERELVAAATTATTTPDDAALYAFRIFLAALAAATTTPDAALSFLLGSGTPIGVMTQRPTHWILTLGNFGAVQTYMPSDTGGWWDPGRAGLSVWAAYQPKDAASLAASYADLSGNGNDVSVGVAPTWDATNGWKFNGSTQYLTTAFVPQDDQTQSMIVQYTTLTTREVLCGAFTSPDGFFLRGHHSDSDEVTYRQGVEAIKVSPQLLAGNLCVAGDQGYRNGVVDGPTIGGYTIVPTHSTYIGCLNMDDVAGLFDAVYIQAIAIYDCTLIPTQVLAVATAMAAL